MTTLVDRPTAEVRSAPEPRRRRNVNSALITVMSFAVAGLLVVPVAYVILGGFRTNAQINNDPAGMPSPWVFSNYTDVLVSSTFWAQVGNSLFTALATTLIVLALAFSAAFALSRFSFRGREALYGMFTLGLLFPLGVAILPLYLLLRDLQLLGTLWGVIIPQAAFGLPMTIVILRPFIQAVPIELEDAASIDGCTKFGFFRRILTPLSVPVLITVGVLAFVGSWNGYLLPLLTLTDPSTFTLPLGVAAFSTQYSSDTAKILAFTALSMLPALTFFLALQKHIVGGMAGAVKG